MQVVYTCIIRHILTCIEHHNAQEKELDKEKERKKTYTTHTSTTTPFPHTTAQKLYTYVHVCMFTYIHVRTCIYTCTYMYTCIYLKDGVSFGGGGAMSYEEIQPVLPNGQRALGKYQSLYYQLEFIYCIHVHREANVTWNIHIMGGTLSSMHTILSPILKLVCYIT